MRKLLLGSERFELVRVHSDPFMDEVCVEAVAQRNAGNRGPGLGALLNNLGLEGFGVGTALWLQERPA